MIKDIDVLLSNSLKDSVPTCVQIEGKPQVNIDMELVKHQLTANFVKRGLTITDVQKLDKDNIDIPFGQLLEEADVTESSMGVP